MQLGERKRREKKKKRSRQPKHEKLLRDKTIFSTIYIIELFAGIQLSRVCEVSEDLSATIFTFNSSRQS